MRTTSALIVLTSLLAPFVAADLHYSAVCVNKAGGVNVYNAGATKAACNDYLHRNTGNKQWDKCPDCTMKNISGLNVCQSNGKHIGGDEMEYYCKQHGAGSMAN